MFAIAIVKFLILHALIAIKAAIPTALKEVTHQSSHNYLLIALVILLVALSFICFKIYRKKENTNSQLAKLKDALTESELKYQHLTEMKDNLIRVIGHDLKNPINSVSGFIELNCMNSQSGNVEKVKYYTGIITNTIAGIGNLLDNLLYWAKLQQGRFELARDGFLAKSLIEQAVVPYEVMALNKNIHIKIDSNPAHAAYADSVTVSIIIGNLVNNAIKYSKKEGNILIRTAEIGDKLKFEVQDFGIGIEEETLSHLFDESSFKTTLGTNEEKGTGFGLKICKQFVEMNGGVLSVKSEVGKGTCFYFSLDTFDGEAE